ncbi:MAG: DUF1592 domain-containing protein [Lentisphaeraceae bacterium]|nr:DUF1592 domain-containing protein [Lentisphaeraceae bacterium]
MNRFLVLVLTTALITGCSKDSSESGQTTSSEPHPAVALLDQHCFRCHKPKKKKGKVDLASFIAENSKLENLKLWKHALVQIEDKSMPPEGKKQPTEEERQQMASWLKQTLQESYGELPDDPGKTVVRRLNRREYENTLNDLLKIDSKVSEDLPLDSVGFGFDNIAGLLSVPPLLLEKYLRAARAAVDIAILDDTNPKLKVSIEAGDFKKLSGAGDLNSGYFGLWSNGTIEGSLNIPYKATYKITLKGYQSIAGNEPAKVLLKINDYFSKTINVDATRKAAKDYTFTTKLNKGTQKFTASFLNDYYDSKKKQDRNVFIRYIQVEGPVSKMEIPLSHRTSVPFASKDNKPNEALAKKNLEAFLTRAFRNKVDQATVQPYLNLYNKMTKAGRNHLQALKTAYVASLVSTKFLFRQEQAPKEIASATNYELASRLSYFLTSSMPDDRLLQLAAEKKLTNKQVLLTEAKRLLKSDAVKEFSKNFAGQWLQLRSLDRLQPDTQVFPEWNHELKESMKMEATTFFEDIVLNNRPMREFIATNKIFINETLAKHYGLKGIKGDRIRRVDTKKRGGILTLASVLSVTSEPARTSPVKRGKWVLDEVLGTPPPPPPENVSLDEATEADPTLTFREKLAKHRDSDDCRGCHSKMDPMGFSFENYDALGKWRDKESGRPIQAGGTMPSGLELTGVKSLQDYLIKKEDQFVEHLVSKLIIYATGRGLEEVDFKTISNVMEKTKAKNYKFQDVILEIVQSPTFTLKKM